VHDSKGYKEGWGRLGNERERTAPSNRENSISKNTETVRQLLIVSLVAQRCGVEHELVLMLRVRFMHISLAGPYDIKLCNK